jgi:hypothetical protein
MIRAGRRDFEVAFPELSRMARTTDALREAVLTDIDTGGFSNGPPEAMNCWSRRSQMARATRFNYLRYDRR